MWVCTFQMKTVIYKDDWIFIYFSKSSDSNYQCNICHESVELHEGMSNQILIDHMIVHHKSIYDIHKESSNENIGFRIEFLQLNVGKDSEKEALILGDVSGVESDDYSAKQDKDKGESEMQYILIADDTKKEKLLTIKDLTPVSEKTKKRSWVWKYFTKLSSIIFKCNICSVVLSIKGSNTNNMNRHMKSRHPALFNREMAKNPNRRKDCGELTDVGYEVEIMHSGKMDEGDSLETPRTGGRVSWVWNYFDRTSKTHAQCKLCRRSIAHGGNATGNMNRHLKALHEEIAQAFLQNQPKLKEIEDSESTKSTQLTHQTPTPEEKVWIWKLFSDDEEHFFECKMCGFKCMKFSNPNKSIAVILKHLKSQHEVVSGDQIVTAAECTGADMDESTIAVDFLKDTEEI